MTVIKVHLPFAASVGSVAADAGITCTAGAEAGPASVLLHGSVLTGALATGGTVPLPIS